MIDTKQTHLNGGLHALAFTQAIAPLVKRVRKPGQWWKEPGSDEEWLAKHHLEVLHASGKVATHGRFILLVGTIHRDDDTLVDPPDSDEWMGPGLRGRAKLLHDALRTNGLAVTAWRNNKRPELVHVFTDWTSWAPRSQVTT